MLNETFYLDGVDAREFGIYLQRPMQFSEAVAIVNKQSIPGRNGDFLWDTGAFENRSGIASCFCLQKNVEKSVSAAGRFLLGKRGYRRLETSDDPEHFWLARVENSPQIEMRMGVLAPFEIVFDCKPQRFLKSGESPIILNNSGDTIYNPYSQTALPLIKLNVAPAEMLSINNHHVIFEQFTGLLYLDSENQNAYNDEGNQNMAINMFDFPALPPGQITVRWSAGISGLEIIPRWWEL